MGGSIGLESALGSGSMFWFEVPLLKVPAGATAREEASDATVVLVGSPPALEIVAPLVEKVVGHVKPASTVDAAVDQWLDLRSHGVAVPAVIVSGEIDQAVQVFEQISALEDHESGSATALIYVSSDPRAAKQDSRIKRLADVQIVPSHGTERHLRNAVHAATTRDYGDRGEVIDLADVLRQNRQPARILVAEDNATNLAILRQLLERAGHTVVTATDGEEALDLYESESLDLAILDFNMPERNGLEVVSAIRMMEPQAVHLPVIILSAAVTVEARERAKRAGADEFVGKPFDAAALLLSIDRLVRRISRTGKTVGTPPAKVAPSATLEQIPLLDTNRLADVERIASTPDFLSQLLRGFRDDVELLLRKLDAAIASGQSSVIGDVLHSIKGASVGIGATQLAARCAALEEPFESGHYTQVYAAIPSLRQCFDATVRQIGAYSLSKHRVAL